MARLTLSFKGQNLKIFTLEGDETVIGRDVGCAIVIDSLAIEPRHALIRNYGTNCSIEPMDKGITVLVNDTRIETQHELTEGDVMQIGKHTLTFSAVPIQTMQESSAPAQAPVSPDSPGWLQILSGSHLGRTIRLDKAFTRIGSTDTNLAVIARRHDGYHLSHLNGETTPVVNNQEIGELTHKLGDEDNVKVGELQVQFFTDSAQAPPESNNMNKTSDQPEQRKFSRIPFDVSVTLRLGDAQWESTLADISLHGALIHTPDGFEPAVDAQYKLGVHLEGGPDIEMDVHVAHQEEGTTGLRCDDIDVDSITHLRRLVELNLGDPELLERELSALAPVDKN
ncbi:FIG01056990: hypothetical protein [hydrothermal vent metagenome]|uniref:FHA domain-containing protein n=1 Tax=hydrothermal vent metagenome TaxID=652676 RepID=A0A3B0Y8B0_9ZZZZ